MSMKKPADAAPRTPPPAPWLPDRAWHLKALGGIFLALVLVYFGLSAFLSRLPPPYGLREIPRELTPWLKK